MKIFRRLYPVVAFFGGFIVDALTLGKRVRVLDFWQLGAYLAGAAVFILWLAWRDAREKEPPLPAADLKGAAFGVTPGILPAGETTVSYTITNAGQGAAAAFVPMLKCICRKRASVECR